MTRFQFPPGDVAHAEDELIRAVTSFQESHDVERIDVFVNRQNGVALAVSYWAEYDAMRAASDDADEARAEVALEATGWVERVDEYEVVERL